MEAPGWPEASKEYPLSASACERSSTLSPHRDIHEGLEVVETERGAVAPGTGLILERSGEGRCKERPFTLTFRQIVALMLP